VIKKCLLVNKLIFIAYLCVFNILILKAHNLKYVAKAAFNENSNNYFTPKNATTIDAGPHYIGTGKEYANLTAVAADLNTNSLIANTVFYITDAYNGTSETFPITFSVFTQNFTVSIMPDPAATSTFITEGNAIASNPLIILNGTNNITFDGRKGGVGITNNWTFRNTGTATATATFRFINGAQYNTLTYLTLESQDTISTSGVVEFLGTSNPKANSNNSITYCNICGRSDVTGMPINGIYSYGKSSAVRNTANTITYNNIFNYGADNSTSAGINLDNYNDAWVIQNNSFYQTAPKYASTGQIIMYGIQINYGSNHTISTNYFGGTSPLCNGGSLTIDYSSTLYANRYIAIALLSGITSADINGNTINNFYIRTNSANSATGGVFCGIYSAAGNNNIGTTSANYIGSMSKTDAIKIIPTKSGAGLIVGINNASSGTVNISNNNIGGISNASTTPSVNVKLSGIYISNGSVNLTGNVIGGNITNSLYNGTASTTGAVTIYGIDITGGNVTTQNNIIKNLSVNSSNATCSTTGISFTANNTGTISQNQISYITGLGSVCGINVISVIAGQTISSNTISNITIDNNVPLRGIAISAGSGAASTVQNNVINNISHAGSFDGIFISGGDINVSGNIIGDATSANNILLAGNCILTGINNISTGTVVIQNNTIANIVASGINIASTVGSNILTGIYTTSGIVSNNNIFNLNTSNTTLSTNIAGIAINSSNGNVNVFANKVNRLTNASSSGTASVNGLLLKPSANQITAYNNMIVLGTSQTTPIFRGIWLNENAASTANIYFNSVYIENAATSYGLVRENVTTTLNIKNNIFYNAAGGYAIGNLGTTTGWTACNFNSLYSSNATKVGNWSNADNSFLQWTSNSNGDANSFSKATTFYLSTSIYNYEINVVPTSSCCFLNGSGTTGLGITTDFYGNTRSTTRPDIGAAEFTPQGAANDNTSDFWTGNDGTNSTDWSYPANWGCELTPLSTTDITIGNLSSLPVIAGTAVCQNLTISPNASLTFTSGSFHVYGNFLLKSDATGYGSFVDTSSTATIIDGTQKMERYIAANIFHDISMPLSLVNSNIFLEPAYGFQNKNFYYYDETIADYWGNLNSTAAFAGWKNPAQNTMLNVGCGYSLYYPSVRTYLIYGGNFNKGSYALNLTNQNRAGNAPDANAWNLYDGWNFVGNPYPSAIDWDAATGWTKTNIDGAVYLYNGTQYQYYLNGVGLGGATRYLAATQGFYVKMSTGKTSGLLAMTNSVRTNNKTAPQNKSLQNTINQNLVRFQLTGNNYTDETVFRLLPDATSDFDSQYDAYKKFANTATVPHLYTISGDTQIEFAINSLSVNDDVINLPLGYSVGVAGNYTIKSTDFPQNTEIWLNDALQNTNVNLATGTFYSFYSDAGKFNNRFTINYTASYIWSNANATNQWSDSLNWNFNREPSITKNVYISSNSTPILSQSAGCKNLLIDANSILTIEQGKSLKISGDLIIKADTIHTSGIYILGSLNVVGNSSIERFYNSTIPIFISSPVSAYFNSPNELLQSFDESTNSWTNLPTGTKLIPAKGYRLLTSSFVKINYSSTLNSGTLLETASLTSTDKGWNLIGNPFAAPLRIDDFINMNVKPNNSDNAIAGAVYLPATNGYGCINLTGSVNMPNGFDATSPIETGQGFFVKTIRNGNLYFKNSLPDYQRKNVSKTDTLSKLKLNIQNEKSTYEMLIGFNANASNTFDELYDAPLIPFDTLLTFYSINQDQNFSIQTFASVDNLDIPLGFKVSQAGNYVINKIQLQNFGDLTNIYLIDNFTNQSFDLKELGNYSFSTDSGTFNNRFELHFENMIITNVNKINYSKSSKNEINIYAFENMLTIESSKNQDAIIEVYNTLGQMVFQRKEVLSKYLTFAINQPTGNYVVCIKTNDNVVNRKVFICKD